MLHRRIQSAARIDEYDVTSGKDDTKTTCCASCDRPDATDPNTRNAIDAQRAGEPERPERAAWGVSEPQLLLTWRWERGLHQDRGVILRATYRRGTNTPALILPSRDTRRPQKLDQGLLSPVNPSRAKSPSSCSYPQIGSISPVDGNVGGAEKLVSGAATRGATEPDSGPAERALQMQPRQLKAIQ